MPEAVRQDRPLVSEFRVVYPGLPAITLSIKGRLTLRESPYVHCAREIRGLFSSEMRVRDAQRYTICWPAEARVPCLRPNRERSTQFSQSAFYDRVPEADTILLLLESPHVEEYQSDPESGWLRRNAPAQGNTGRRIQEHFADVLSRGELSHELCDGAKVVIANPVQYLASLRSIVEILDVDTKERREIRSRVRDAVWLALWSIEAVRRDFEERLRRYEARVVINACTRTMSNAWTAPYPMSAHVAAFVAAHCPSAEQYETTHPSRWFDERNRWLKHVPL